MKKLKVIVTSIIVLAIVGSAFSFNSKKTANFCTSGGTNSTLCTTESGCSLKRVAGTQNAYYVVDWDGNSCSQTCTTSARFILD